MKNWILLILMAVRRVWFLSSCGVGNSPLPRLYQKLCDAGIAGKRKKQAVVGDSVGSVSHARRSVFTREPEEV